VPGERPVRRGPGSSSRSPLPSANKGTVNARARQQPRTVAGGFVIRRAALHAHHPSPPADGEGRKGHGDRRQHTEGTESFKLHLSTQSGATVADGQGVGPILDDEERKTGSSRSTTPRCDRRRKRDTSNAVFFRQLSHRARRRSGQGRTPPPERNLHSPATTPPRAVFERDGHHDGRADQPHAQWYSKGRDGLKRGPTRRSPSTCAAPAGGRIGDSGPASARLPTTNRR